MKFHIHDLIIRPLRQIFDERGGVYHFLKASDKSFHGFGEAYYSKINPGVIKGWKFHKQIYQNFCVPIGSVRIVIYDNRYFSPSKGKIDEILLDNSDHYYLLCMPPQLWYSFKCESDGYALLANIIDKPYDPEESINLPLDNKVIPYEWK